MATPVGDSYAVASGGVIAAGRYHLSPFWRDLPSGWSELPFAGSPPGAGMFAYSGMALDSDGGKCYFVGGGHNDSNYSGVYMADLESLSYSESFPSYFTAMPTIEQAKAVTDNANYPGAIVVGGNPVQPISRHTYHSIQWVKSLGVVTVAGGSTYSGPGEMFWYDPVTKPDGAWLNAPNDFWTYNPALGSFSYKGSSRTNLTNFYASRCIAHPSDGNIYSFIGDGNGHLRCLVINAVTGQTTIRPTLAADDTAASLAMAFDESYRYIYLLVQNGYDTGTFRLLKYDIQTDVFTLMPVNGGVLPAFLYDEVFSLTYSTKTKKLYAVSKRDDGLKVYDTTTGVWSSQSLATLANFTQTSGRFIYDRKRDAILMFVAEPGPLTVRAYAFRE